MLTAATAIKYLDTLSLTAALWWLIENVNQDTPGATEIHTYLRGRVRKGK